MQPVTASRALPLKTLGLVAATILVIGLIGAFVALFVTNVSRLRPPASAGLPDPAPLPLLPTPTETPAPPPTNTPLPPLPSLAPTEPPPITEILPTPRTEPTPMLIDAPTPTPMPEPRLGGSQRSSRTPRSTVRCGVRVVHVVKPGENLFRIALRYNTTVASISRRNNISDPRLVRVGQRLNIVTCR
jgi:hypothetical protein